MIFRRVNGRIIPIRDPRDKKEAGAYIAGGLVTGAAAGHLAAKSDLLAAHATNESRKHFEEHVAAKLSKNAKKAHQMFKVAAKGRLQGMALSRTATRLKRGGAAVGGSLVGAGVYKMLGKSDLSTSEKTGIAATSGIAAHFAIRSAYTRFFQPSGISEFGIKHGKSTLNALKHAAVRIAVKGFKL